jgi:hypothetical protein
MNNKLNYEDTDRKIELEIYGLIFEVKKEIEDIDAKELKEQNKINISEIIDKIFGNGATDKINKKRIQDGYEVMDTQVALTIISYAVNAYVNASVSPINEVINNYNYKVNKMNRFRSQNQRRNYRYRRY